MVGLPDENKQKGLMTDKEILLEREILKARRDMWIQWLRDEVSEDLIANKMSKPVQQWSRSG